MTISPSFVAERTSTAVNRHYAGKLIDSTGAFRGGTSCDILQRKMSVDVGGGAFLLQKQPPSVSAS